MFTIYNQSIPFESFPRSLECLITFVFWASGQQEYRSAAKDNSLQSWYSVNFSFFYTVTTMYLSALWVSAIRNWTFVTFQSWFSYHTWSCHAVASQKLKTKEWVKFLALKVVACRLRESFLNSVWVRNKTVICKVVEGWSLTRSGRCNLSGNRSFRLQVVSPTLRSIRLHDLSCFAYNEVSSFAVSYEGLHII